MALFPFTFIDKITSPSALAHPQSRPTPFLLNPALSASQKSLLDMVSPRDLITCFSEIPQEVLFTPPPPTPQAAIRATLHSRSNHPNDDSRLSPRPPPFPSSSLDVVALSALSNLVSPQSSSKSNPLPSSPIPFTIYRFHSLLSNSLLHSAPNSRIWLALAIIPIASRLHPPPTPAPNQPAHISPPSHLLHTPRQSSSAM